MFSHDYFKKNGRNVLLEWCLPKKQNISSILEIGAGNGLPLSYLADKLEAQAFGIEPSKKAVQNWEKNKTKINGGENTNLIIGISNNLPFEESKFDLVIFGFCLYLVDRNNLFQSIAVADRVLKDNGFLAIVDFDVSKPYKNKYEHKIGLSSYKNNYANIFLSSDTALINKYSFSNSNSSFSKNMNERISLSLLL